MRPSFLWHTLSVNDSGYDHVGSSFQERIVVVLLACAEILIYKALSTHAKYIYMDLKCASQ